MRINYLFPNKYKRIGLLILIPTALFGIYVVAADFAPDFLNFSVPAIYSEPILKDKQYFGFIENNILNEILGVLIIISSLLVAFSAEKIEDEFIAKIRLESLVWAVIFNYAVLFFAMIFIFELAFLWVMILNMFTILIFFIIRFNWQLSKLQKNSL